MAEVAYRCDKCQTDYPLSGARECDFICQACEQPLKRLAQAPDADDLGAPQFKGDTVKLSALFAAPQEPAKSAALEDQLFGKPETRAPRAPARRPAPTPPPRPQQAAASPRLEAPARREAPAPRAAVRPSESGQPRDLARGLPKPERKPLDRRKLLRQLGLVGLNMLPSVVIVMLLLYAFSSEGELEEHQLALRGRLAQLESQRKIDQQALAKLQARARTLEALVEGPQAVRRLRSQYRQLIPTVVEGFSSAVIHITVKRRTWVKGRTHTRRANGSGFIIAGGFAITNYHVVGSVEEVTCRLYNGEEVDAKVYGSDPASDIALLRLELEGVPGADKIKPAVFGRSGLLKPGELVIALGSPKSLDRTISLGIVSNARRYQDGLPLSSPWVVTGQFNTWIQTDSAINPGSSGGPLIDLAGKVVGVVTRKIRGADNIGFAVPIDHVKQVVRLLRKNKVVHRTTIGVFILPYNPLESKQPAGVRVADVVPRSPADLAGLKSGDVLTRFNGKPIAARFKYQLPAARVQLASAPRRPIKLGVIRESKPLALVVTPRSRKLADDRILYIARLGLYAIEITPELVRTQALHCKAGIWICGIQRGKPFSRHGIRRGDVLLGLDNQKTTTMAVFWKKYRMLLHKRKTPLAFRVQRANGATRVVKLRIGYAK